MSKPAKVLAAAVVIAAFILAILSAIDPQQTQSAHNEQSGLFDFIIDAGIAFFFLLIYAAGACLLIWIVDALVRATIATVRRPPDDGSERFANRSANLS